MLNITVAGRLGRDAEYKQTQQGQEVCSFAVAADVGFGDRKQTYWVDVSRWGKGAKGLSEILRKGSAVAVTGELTLHENGGKTYINGTLYNFTRKFGFKIDRAGNADGYGQSTLDRAYHQKGVAKVEASASLRLDAVSLLERPKVEAGLAAPFQVVLIGAESKKVGTSSVNEMLIISCAASEVSSYKEVANGDQIDVDLGFKAYNPATATDYDAPVSAWLITADSAAY